jgi:hypothetical protein
MKEPDLPSTLRRYREFGGLGANWRLFGSAGAQAKEDIPVCKRFTMASPQFCRENFHVKSIARPELVKSIETHRPFLKGKPFVDERRREIKDARGIHHTVSYDMIRINHYITKSYNEWLAKISRGMADAYGKRKVEDFAKFDYNDEVDTEILKFYPALTKEMLVIAYLADIVDYPVLRHVHQDAYAEIASTDIRPGSDYLFGSPSGRH